MCFGPSTLGAGAKTRLESSMRKFTPHTVFAVIATARNTQSESARQCGGAHPCVPFFALATFAASFALFSLSIAPAAGVGVSGGGSVGCVGWALCGGSDDSTA